MSSIRTKIILAICVVFIFVLGVTSFVGVRTFTRFYSDLAKENLLTKAQSLTVYLNQILALGIPLEEIVGFEEQIGRFLKDHTELTEAAVLDKEGNIIFHNNLQKVGESFNLGKKNLDFSQKGVIWEEGSDNDYHAIAPVFDANKEHVGAVILGIPSEVVLGKQRELTVTILVFAAAAFAAAALILLLVLNRWVTKPLTTILQAIKDIQSSGNLNSSLKVTTKDEIGRLAQEFNDMIAKLKSSYVGLEEKVKEKTSLLDQKVQQMQTQNRKLSDAKSAMLNLLEDAKELENKLRQERNRMNLIISSMGEGLLVVDNKLLTIMMNPTAEALLGVSQKEMLGKSWTRVASTFKSDRKVPIEERSFALAINEGKTIVTNLEADHYYQTASGKRFPVVSITAPLVSEGERIGAVKVFRDATHEKEERAIIEKEVEERTQELREARDKISEGWLNQKREKARLAASIQSLSLGFIITGKDGGVVIANSQALNILGVEKKEECLATLSEALKGKLDLIPYCKSCSLSTKALEFKDIEFAEKYLRIFISPIQMTEDKRECLGLAILIEDITEAKILQRSKDEFFSIASHELRTPLTAIRGNTSMILEYFADKIKDQELREMIDDIHGSSERLIGIVNDFLDMSRLEQGKVEFKKEEIDIVPLAKNVIEEVRVTGSEHGVSMDVAAPEVPLPKIIGDSDKIKEVFLNLIGNGIKFTEKGSIIIGFSQKDNYLEISVKDSGRGIPRENQNLLFRKFQQAGSSLYTRDTTKGTGLGLYISKLMIEGMGGKIWLAESEEGKGSTFAFSLPIAKE